MFEYSSTLFEMSHWSLTEQLSSGVSLSCYRSWLDMLTVRRLIKCSVSAEVMEAWWREACGGGGGGVLGRWRKERNQQTPSASVLIFSRKLGVAVITRRPLRSKQSAAASPALHSDTSQGEAERAQCRTAEPAQEETHTHTHFPGFPPNVSHILTKYWGSCKRKLIN